MMTKIQHIRAIRSILVLLQLPVRTTTISIIRTNSRMKRSRHLDIH